MNMAESVAITLLLAHAGMMLFAFVGLPESAERIL